MRRIFHRGTWLNKDTTDTPQSLCPGVSAAAEFPGQAGDWRRLSARPGCQQFLYFLAGRHGILSAGLGDCQGSGGRRHSYRFRNFQPLCQTHGKGAVEGVARGHRVHRGHRKRRNVLPGGTSSVERSTGAKFNHRKLHAPLQQAIRRRGRRFLAGHGKAHQGLRLGLVGSHYIAILVKFLGQRAHRPGGPA